VSSELERLLREARDALPAPDESSTQRARSRALASLRRRRRRARALVLAAAMLVSAVALGITAGSLNAPGVTAAREPAMLGFVPEPGW
jgi:ferric-dicitrate binding protein FerR (iron transport regulator)